MRQVFQGQHPERAFASVRQLASHLVNGDTLGALIGFRDGGHALLGAILATPFDGRIAVYGSKGWVEVRDKAHPESPEGWTLTKARIWLEAYDKRNGISGG